MVANTAATLPAIIMVQTWRNGRELQSLTTGGKKTSYEYDVDSLRTLKTNSDGSYSVYYWLGNLLLAEERHTGGTTRVLVFSYDENNSPIGFQFKTNNGPWNYYLYAKNIQGDIVAIYRRDINADGTRSATHIANYEYDPWGNILSIKNAAGADMSGYPDCAANVNPLRYRGYYYDNESGFYYLQSRYYGPTIGRFVNADGYVSTGQGLLGYNMFAYCNNNPVKYLDKNGEFLGTLIGAVVGAAVGAVEAAIKGENVLAGAASGAVSGAITGAAADVIAITGGTGAVVIAASAGSSFLGSVASSAVEAKIKNEKIDVRAMTINAVEDAAFGALFGYMSGPVKSKLGDVAKKGLKKVAVNTFCRNAGKKMLRATGENLLSSATVFVSKTFSRFLYRQVRTLF